MYVQCKYNTLPLFLRLVTLFPMAYWYVYGFYMVKLNTYALSGLFDKKKLWFIESAVNKNVSVTLAGIYKKDCNNSVFFWRHVVIWMPQFQIWSVTMVKASTDRVRMFSSFTKNNVPCFHLKTRTHNHKKKSTLIDDDDSISQANPMF